MLHNVRIFTLPPEAFVPSLLVYTETDKLVEDLKSASPLPTRPVPDKLLGLSGTGIT